MRTCSASAPAWPWRCIRVLNNLVLVFPVIVMAVIAYFHHAMKPETARLEPEQLLRNPWIAIWTIVTARQR